MKAKKVLLVCDRVLDPDAMLKSFKNLEKYGAEIKLVVDNPADMDEEEFKGRMLKIEQEGPEAFEPAPEIMDNIEDTEILVVHLSIVNRKVIDAAKNLKLLGILRGGTENVDMGAVDGKGIIAFNAAARSADSVSDFTVGMILTELKNIARGAMVIKEGKWVQDFPNSSYSHNLRGRTIGLMGLGQIGSRVAKKMKGFDVNLLVFDEYMSDEDIKKAGGEPVSKEKLLKESDFVSLHLRYVSGAPPVIGKEELAMMKRTAFLINTARAGLVDEGALLKALKEGTIGGAALDVFSDEPLSLDSPFLKLENVTLTPHIGGRSCDTLNNSFELIYEDLERYYNDEPLQNRKN